MGGRISLRKNVIIIIFLLFTIWAVFPTKDTRDSGYLTSELTTREMQFGEFTVRCYTDEEGRIVKPANSYYSVIVKEKNESGLVIGEQYFLTEEKLTADTLFEEYESKAANLLTPVTTWGGQSGVRYEYNELNQISEVIYLDENGEEKILTTGYSRIKRQSDEYGRRIREEYYNLAGERAKSTSGNFGSAYTYYDSDAKARGEEETDETASSISWLVETIMYLDKYGNIIQSGQAGVHRLYDENNRTSEEMFLDRDGNIVQNYQGVYGYAYSYDSMGRQTIMLFLDAEGNPAMCSSGYCVTKRTFYKDGSLKTEMFYDVNGEPAVLSRGESGYYHKLRTSVPLNANGVEMLMLDSFLRGNPYLVILVSIIIWLVSGKLSKRGNRLLLVAYVGFIVYMTLLNRGNRTGYSETEAFNSFRVFFESYSIRLHFIENVYLFVPLGMLLYRVFGSWKVVFIAVVLSFFIEQIQYYAQLGTREMDDFLANSFGGCMGCLWVVPAEKLWFHRKKKNNDGFAEADA